MSISPASLANLRPNGRPPLFTEASALLVLRAKMESGATTLPDFIKNMQESGELPPAISIPTLQRLFSGKMFPDLIDPETSKVFDYGALPRAPMGRPSRFNEDGVDPVTKERRRGIPPLRQWLLDKVLEEARRIIDIRISSAISLAQGREYKLEQRIAGIEKDLAQLRTNPLLVGGRLG